MTVTTGSGPLRDVWRALLAGGQRLAQDAELSVVARTTIRTECEGRAA